MTRGLIFSSEYNLFLVCWLKESGVLGGDYDVLLSGAEAGTAARLRETGYFGRVLTLGDRDGRGFTAGRRYEAMQGILQGPGRVFRKKASYLELLSPRRFYDGDAKDWDKYFSHTTIFEGSVPYVDYLLRKKAAFSCWEHGLISVKGSKIRMFSFPYWAGAHSLWCGVHGLEHPHDALGELCTAAPELATRRLRERLHIKKVPQIDRNNAGFAEAMNTLFAARRGERLPPGMVFFPHVYQANPRYMAAERRFLEESLSILRGMSVFVKPHPARRWDDGVPPPGAELLPSSHLPWEMTLFNNADWDKRLLASPYCTTALLSPKVYFGDEPYVLNLSRLFPEFNAGRHGELSLELAEDAGWLYRNPEKYRIPETWDEAWDFLRGYAAACRAG